VAQPPNAQPVPAPHGAAAEPRPKDRQSGIEARRFAALLLLLTLLTAAGVVLLVVVTGIVKF
jgi:hypothetical protein